MRATAMVATFLLAGSAAAAPLTMDAPLGASWGATYGFPPVLAVPFVEPARALGAGFTRVTLYWSQLEPKPGVPRWNDLDAYVAQLRTPAEGLVTIASASPWATRVPAWVFPSSPAKDPQAYYAFIHATVLHVKGRVRYFQSDPEPNNPFFWNGGVDDFIAQQTLFYRAVKDADPEAVVVLAGCDGDFDPTERSTRPQQVASLAFFTKVIAEAAHAYDVFDLRLYGDPYTIPARAALIRARIDRAGGTQPIVATEYAGPTFFELPPNRRWFAGLQGPDAAGTVRTMRSMRAELPVETQLFVDGTPSAPPQRLLALQVRDLVVRNLLALSSGIQKTAFWDLWHDAGDPASANAMMFGTLRLLSLVDGRPTGPTGLGAAFARVTARLGDAVSVDPLPVADQADVHAFVVRRSRGDAMLVAWRRPPRPIDDAPPAPVRIPWSPAIRATTLAGDPVAFRSSDGALELSLGADPVFFEAGPA